MSRRKPAKPYWEMTTEELREATKRFDEEFVADEAKPMSSHLRRRWQRCRAKSPGTGHVTGEASIAEGDNEL
jgi:hypothetical protein